VDVLLGVIWGVVLDDPVHCRDVQATRCHVCAQQDALVRLAELKEGAGALLLLLLAVDVLHRDVDVVEQLTGGDGCVCVWEGAGDNRGHRLL
jgi:hypothetical protein